MSCSSFSVASPFADRDPQVPVRNRPQLLLTVLGAVLLGGCAHIERYPQSWEPVQVGAITDCNAVAATYANEGENSNGDRIALALWLEPRQYKSNAEHTAYESDLTEAQTVQLQLTANVLTLIASGKNMHREWSFNSNKREFECHHGVVRIHRFEVTNDIMLGVSKGSDYLYRVGDHLVVKSKGVAVGLMLLIVPVGGGGTSWGRFAVTPRPSAEHGLGADSTP